jgi:hypothetical protein
VTILEEVAGGSGLGLDSFDASKEEEYEDSQGNVQSRATYEDLAR